jgi:hypothetical protein
VFGSKSLSCIIPAALQEAAVVLDEKFVMIVGRMLGVVEKGCLLILCRLINRHIASLLRLAIGQWRQECRQKGGREEKERTNLLAAA